MSNLKSDQMESHRILLPLRSLNFFMADMQAGIGPFLGIFLLAHGWKSGLIGSVMTIGGVAGMIMTAPAGALIDATKRKRMYVVIPGIFTILASAIILLLQNFWLVTISQVATAIAGCGSYLQIFVLLFSIGCRQAFFTFCHKRQCGTLCAPLTTDLNN
jgi:MFS family permease